MKILQRLLVTLLLSFGLWGSAAAVAQTITYFHNDISGSPLVATDEAGEVLWKEQYSPYGDKIERALAANSNRIGYHGQAHDDHSGLSYMGARYYDPVLGRFMGVDPVGFVEGNLHSANRYAYANNNPYKFVDPDGRLVQFLIPAAGMLFGGGLYIAATTPAMPHGRSAASPENSVPGFGGEPLTKPWGPIFNEEAKGGEKPSLLDPQGEQHILDGDGPNAGGGHRHGTGKPGKSEFPANWSDDKIKGEVSDVATDPGSVRTTQPNGRIRAQGTRDGVDITVIVEPNSRGGRIVTGFPTNTPRNQ